MSQNTSKTLTFVVFCQFELPIYVVTPDGQVKDQVVTLERKHCSHEELQLLDNFNKLCAFLDTQTTSNENRSHDFLKYQFTLPHSFSLGLWVF